MGQVETVLTVGACDEGGVESECGGSGFVGVGSWGAVVVAVGGAGKDGACGLGWTSRCLALKGRSAVQMQSVAVNGGGMGAASAAPAAVCDVRCYLRSSLRCLCHRVYPQTQLHRCWRSERGNALTCPKKTQLSFV